MWHARSEPPPPGSFALPGRKSNRTWVFEPGPIASVVAVVVVDPGGEHDGVAGPRRADLGIDVHDRLAARRRSRAARSRAASMPAASTVAAAIVERTSPARDRLVDTPAPPVLPARGRCGPRGLPGGDVGTVWSRPPPAPSIDGTMCVRAPRIARAAGSDGPGPDP